jgi:hypothetical protein
MTGIEIIIGIIGAIALAIIFKWLIHIAPA